MFLLNFTSPIPDAMDIPRLFTALAEWLACMSVIYFQKKRFAGIKLIFIYILSFIIISAFQLLAEKLPIELWVLGMATAVGLMYLFILICCDISPLSVGYWCFLSFIVAEFAASVEWQFYCYLIDNISFLAADWFKIIFLILVFFLVYFILFMLEKRYVKNNFVLEIKPRDFFNIAIISGAIFLISNISFITRNSPLSGQNPSEIFYIRTLVDFCGVLLIYSSREQRLSMQAHHEVEVSQRILEKHYEQYCQSKENFDIINRKYHDLKHQIAVIRAEKDTQKSSKYLKKMEEEISNFHRQYKTGNNVLDTVLGSKTIILDDNDITFTCVVDGEVLSFMDIMDLCSLFGNALDNAIESVKSIKDKEKRLIRLAVYSQNNMLLIKIENYYENIIEYKNGEIMTTKSNNIYHGYGIKSMKHTAEKYGGNLTIKTDNNWFQLCILIPMKNK